MRINEIIFEADEPDMSRRGFLGKLGKGLAAAGAVAAGVKAGDANADEWVLINAVRPLAILAGIVFLNESVNKEPLSLIKNDKKLYSLILAWQQKLKPFIFLIEEIESVKKLFEKDYNQWKQITLEAFDIFLKDMLEEKKMEVLPWNKASSKLKLEAMNEYYSDDEGEGFDKLFTRELEKIKKYTAEYRKAVEKKQNQSPKPSGLEPSRTVVPNPRDQQSQPQQQPQQRAQQNNVLVGKINGDWMAVISNYQRYGHVLIMVDKLGWRNAYSPGQQYSDAKDASKKNYFLQQGTKLFKRTLDLIKKAKDRSTDREWLNDFQRYDEKERVSNLELSKFMATKAVNTAREIGGSNQRLVDNLGYDIIIGAYAVSFETTGNDWERALIKLERAIG